MLKFSLLNSDHLVTSFHPGFISLFNRYYPFMEASFYKRLNDQTVQCILCPHNCQIKNGYSGNCRVRHNSDGKLISLVHSNISALQTDPIEKKPLYHFYPGKLILSVGSYGCNFKCTFCQNHEISQSEEFIQRGNAISSESLVKQALAIYNNIGIAYTYNEPTVWYEFMTETAILAKQSGLKNVMVTNGYINPEPLSALSDHMDAFNVDLKAFNEDFYRNICNGKLDPVLHNIKFLKEKKKHVEITHLLITGLNDNIRQFNALVNWISTELGKETVLHISRYFPRFRYTSPPTSTTQLVDFWHLAREKLHFVYLGNVDHDGPGDTHCPVCKNLVISRLAYQTKISGLDHSGKCNKCETLITVHHN